MVPHPKEVTKLIEIAARVWKVPLEPIGEVLSQESVIALLASCGLLSKRPRYQKQKTGIMPRDQGASSG